MAMRIKCDILICGGGLSGLSLLYRAMKSGIWTGKKIIVVDGSDKTKNDRTWSFWKKEDIFFEELIRHRWQNLFFFSNEGTKVPLDHGGYTYNSIKSIDFYQYVLSYLNEFPDVSFVQTEVLTLVSSESGCALTTSDHTYMSAYAFNSIYQKPPPNGNEQYFLQHFKGVRIRTSEVVPDLPDAWLMDFRTGQENGTTFFYTLPMARDEVFVEYTLFSKEVLPMEEYDKKIRAYINDVLHIGDYEVLEDENGVIPMTDHLFTRFEGNIIHIGTAGGDTRASTGYTFTNTQKTIGKILDSFKSDGHPFFKSETIGLKQQLYDSTLLHVLARRKYKGHELFADLFKHTPAHLIFAFLDAETSVLQDLYIMKSLKIMPFLKSFTKAVFNRLRNKIIPVTLL
jgi:lycopene beta-cyclase